MKKEQKTPESYQESGAFSNRIVAVFQAQFQARLKEVHALLKFASRLSQAVENRGRKHLGLESRPFKHPGRSQRLPGCFFYPNLAAGFSAKLEMFCQPAPASVLSFAAIQPVDTNPAGGAA